MTNKEKFINEVYEAATCEGGLTLSDEAWSYFNELRENKDSNGTLTETGEKVLSWLKENTTRDCTLFSSKIIGEGLFLSPRIISGAARKLVNDGYLYKEGKNPVSYGITEAGANVLPENK